MYLIFYFVNRLILKDIPKESFPTDCQPVILKTEEINSDPIPGMKVGTQ